VDDARKRGFPLKVEVLPEPIMLNMAIRGEIDKQNCSATEMFMSLVTFTTPSVPLCMLGVRNIIVEENMDHLLIGRPVLDEIGFMVSQHLDSVRDKLHLHEFIHIGKEIMEMGKQPSGALSKIILKPADIPEFVKNLPDVLPLAKGNNIRKREQINPSVLNKDQYGIQRGYNDNADYDVLQPSIKFLNLKEQSLFYGDISDGDPNYYHDIEVGQRNSGELANAI
jgi:hypothetical protein